MAPDSNFATWHGATPTFHNNGCTSIVVPITLIDFAVSFSDNILNIEWNSPTGGNSILQIMDVSGRFIKTTAIKNSTSFNKFSKDVSALEHGSIS